MAPLINFSGISSGIDSASLIKALLDRERSARIKPIETKISGFAAQNESYSKLSELLTNLQSSASKFRTVNGSVLSKQAVSSNESVVGAVASNSASNGTYNLTVTQVAKNATLSFDQAFTSSSDTASGTGTLGFTIGTGGSAETVNIALTAGVTTVSDIISSFNSQSDKASASLINTGTTSSPSYKIVVTSNSEGSENGSIAVSNPTLVSATNTLDQAADSEFSISGVTGSFTRSSNSVNDVISGVTFNIQSTGTAKVTINDDASATTTSLQDFVDAYNEIVSFISENDLVVTEADGNSTKNTFGPLANSSIDESLIGSLRSAFSSAAISGGLVNTLADLGISTQRDGTLKFDTDAFKNAITTDPESVRTITSNLGETLSAVDGTIAQYIRFNGIIDQAESSNDSATRSAQSRIVDIEKSLTKQEESLNSRFSRLEGLIGQLNSQQSTLSSLLPR